jgi:integrase
LVLFLVYTGRRIGEAVRLEWGDVDLRAGVATIGRTKNGDPIAVHMPAPLYEALANLPGKREGRVFGYQHRWSVYDPLREVCRRAKVPYLPPHALGRHTFATWMRRYGRLDLRGLMEAGGWRDVKSVARYAHVTADEAGLAADRLPDITANPGKIRGAFGANRARSRR